MSNLTRFRDAQDAPHAGFTTALRELQAGRKTSHWIWYVFPQLAGLGRSSTAVYYGLAGIEEAADYLRDRVLGERLIAAAAAVRTHLANAKSRAVRLEELMGSEIDALKLVSCRYRAIRTRFTPARDAPRVCSSPPDAELPVAIIRPPSSPSRINGRTVAFMQACRKDTKKATPQGCAGYSVRVP